MLLWKLMTGIHIFLYRLTGGRVGSSMRGFNVLLLTSVGRKTGKQRTTPLGYFREQDAYLIVGSNGGLDRHPAWYFNLKHQAQVEIQVKNQHLKVRAEVVEGGDYDRLWQKVVTEAPPYGDYTTKTTRQIPLVLLHPQA